MSAVDFTLAYVSLPHDDGEVHFQVLAPEVFETIEVEEEGEETYAGIGPVGFTLETQEVTETVYDVIGADEETGLPLLAARVVAGLREVKVPVMGPVVLTRPCLVKRPVTRPLPRELDGPATQAAVEAWLAEHPPAQTES